jgi:hypothetical protein
LISSRSNPPHSKIQKGNAYGRKNQQRTPCKSGQSRGTRKEEGQNSKKAGIAALIVALLVPIVLAVRALTTSKNAKKNKKKIVKKYAELSKKVKRFIK